MKAIHDTIKTKSTLGLLLCLGVNKEEKERECSMKLCLDMGEVGWQGYYKIGSKGKSLDLGHFFKGFHVISTTPKLRSPLGAMCLNAAAVKSIWVSVSKSQYMGCILYT